MLIKIFDGENLLPQVCAKYVQLCRRWCKLRLGVESKANELSASEFLAYWAIDWSLIPVLPKQFPRPVALLIADRA